MLSYIVQISERYEQSHGFKPNLLYLNKEHLQHLRDGFDESIEIPQIMNMLGMELILDNECTHPHVSWVQMTRQQLA